MAAVAVPTWLLLPELWDSKVVRACPWPSAWGDKVVVVVDVEVVGGTVVAVPPVAGTVVGESEEGDEEVATRAMTTATTAAAMTAMAMSRPLPCRRSPDASAPSEGGGSSGVPVGRAPTDRAVTGGSGRAVRTTAVVGGITGTVAWVGVPDGMPMDRPHSRQNRALATLSCPTGHGLIRADPQVGQYLAVKSGTGRGWPWGQSIVDLRWAGRCGWAGVRCRWPPKQGSMVGDGDHRSGVIGS